MSSEKGEISQCLKSQMPLNSADVSAVEAVRVPVLGSAGPTPTDLHCPECCVPEHSRRPPGHHRPGKGQGI